MRKDVSKKIFVFLPALLLIFTACQAPHYEPEQRIPYDPDLFAWQTASWSPFTVGDRITGFAFGNDLYVAAASTGVIAWSYDGDIWHPASVYPGSFPGLNAVAFGNTASGGLFVAVGNNGRYAWSQDGKTWTQGADQMTGFGARDIRGIAFGNGMFVAVGDNWNKSYSLGINYSDMVWRISRPEDFPFLAPAPSMLNDIAFSQEHNRFYVVGDNGRMGWSDNPPARSWEFRSTPAGNANITSVAVGRYGDDIGIGIVFGNSAAIAVRADLRYFDADLQTFLFEGNRLNVITWGGNTFVAAGSAAKIGWWPADNPSNLNERFWRALSFQDFHRWEITALAACNGRFFAGNVDGKIAFSR